MTGLIIAVTLQWVVIAALALVILVLLRQVGLLHERMGPVGALKLPGGVDVGEPSPPMTLKALGGETIELGHGAYNGQGLFFFFLSPTCPICKSLLPVVRSLARQYAGQVQFVLASDGDEAQQMALREREGLEDFPFVLSADLGMAFGVGKLPYAVLVDPAGIVRAKGLVNNREHLESLFEAQRHGVASIQDYLSQKKAGTTT